MSRPTDGNVDSGIPESMELPTTTRTQHEGAISAGFTSSEEALYEDPVGAESRPTSIPLERSSGLPAPTPQSVSASSGLVSDTVVRPKLWQLSESTFKFTPLQMQELYKVQKKPTLCRTKEEKDSWDRYVSHVKLNPQDVIYGIPLPTADTRGTTVQVQESAKRTLVTSKQYAPVRGSLLTRKTVLVSSSSEDEEDDPVSRDTNDVSFEKVDRYLQSQRRYNQGFKDGGCMSLDSIRLDALFGDIVDWVGITESIMAANSILRKKIVALFSTRLKEQKTAHRGGKKRYSVSENGTTHTLSIVFGLSETSASASDLTPGRFLTVMAGEVAQDIHEILSGTAMHVKIRPSPIMEVIGFSKLWAKWDKLRSKFSKAILEDLNINIDDQLRSPAMLSFEGTPRYGLAKVLIRSNLNIKQNGVMDKVAFCHFALNVERLPFGLLLTPASAEVGATLALLTDMRNCILASLSKGTVTDKKLTTFNFYDSYIRRSKQIGVIVDQQMFYKVFEVISKEAMKHFILGKNWNQETKDSTNESIAMKVAEINNRMLPILLPKHSFKSQSPQLYLTGTMYDIIVLKEGYTRPEPHGTLRSCGSVTLLKGDTNNILVDTGNPWDRDSLIQGLNDQSLKTDDIHYVICSHGHSDHCGNLNLFTKAVQIVGFDICQNDQFYLHDFKQGIPYEIDDDVEIWPTPGHTGSDVSVIVKRTNLGTVAITGDLFECEADLENPCLWQEQSERPHLQEQSRINVLRVADFIIPGHGIMFQVPREYKDQMRVVMMMEEHISTPSMTSSKSECIIFETD